MPENANAVDSAEVSAAVDSAAQQEQNQPAGGSAPKTFTAEEVDATVKARIDKQRAKHEVEMSELQKQLDELKQQSAKVEAERDELRHKQELASWAEQASAETGVPSNLLRGSTLEEITEHAKAIKAALPVYPVVTDGGEPKTPRQTKESILAIENEKERLAAIRDNAELFTS